MMPLKADPRSRWLRSFGILIIAVLALASAGHFWHHLTDDCENGRQSFPHPCAQCAGFHAGVLAESIQTAGAPSVSPVIDVFVADDADRVGSAHGVASPRAPPLS